MQMKLKLTVAAAVAAVAGLTFAQDVQVVKIGSVAPMSGGQAHYGKDNANGVLMAVDDLNKENLVQDNLGDWWIRKGRVKLERRRKASSISNIPLLPVPLAILEKYREHPICVKKGCCLPVMCNQKMNSYLKEIADFCGIKKNLTTHVARHTFGTTVTLANNVPLQDVSVMLGHASTRMTQHYARVMNSSLKEAMNHVKKRLEW